MKNCAHQGCVTKGVFCIRIGTASQQCLQNSGHAICAGPEGDVVDACTPHCAAGCHQCRNGCLCHRRVALRHRQIQSQIQSHSFDAKDQARPPRWRRRTPCWLHALSGSLTHAEQVHHVLSPCVQSLTSDGMPSKTLAAATALVYRPPSLLTPAGGACPGTATTAYALLG